MNYLECLPDDLIINIIEFIPQKDDVLSIITYIRKISSRFTFLAGLSYLIKNDLCKLGRMMYVTTLYNGIKYGPQYIMASSQLVCYKEQYGRYTIKSIDATSNVYTGMFYIINSKSLFCLLNICMYQFEWFSAQWN